MTRKLCIECKHNLAEKKGDGYFYKKCTTCRKAGKSYGKPSYRLGKKKSCECCGFVAVHPCQLDVDHIDGNHGNNDEGNLQTLCANCHRLKTVLNRDYLSNPEQQDDSEEVEMNAKILSLF